jgi:hypothetical protein
VEAVASASIASADAPQGVIRLSHKLHTVAADPSNPR